MTNTTLVLICLAPVSLWYSYLFLYDFFMIFFHELEAAIGVVEKRFFGFLEYSSISISKKELQWKVGVLNPNTFAGLLGLWKTTRLKGFISVLYMQKKAFQRNFRRVRRYARAIACFTWQSLNKSYCLFGPGIYVFLNEK